MTTEVSPLLVTDDSQVRFIRLNRPAELNALRRVDIEAATEAVNQIPHSARALVFAGEGERAFGTGVHLENFVSMTPERAREFISALARLFAAVRRAAVPSVAMIRGYCLGGAFELAMACDLRVAATDAWFGLPEIKLGIPSVIDAALLERHVGLGMAREMILTGDSYDVDQMERRGLVNAVA
jgi:enoyl-CoA hydratase/carnithine racemase